MKKCSCCKIEKPFEEFHRNKSGKFGYANYCIECKKMTRDNPRGLRPSFRVFDKARGLYVVYEFYDKDDKCIYVGQTGNFIQRLHDHKYGSKFYSEIVKVVCNVVESLPDMAFLEAQYILQKKPKYNQRIVGASESRFYIEPMYIVEYDINGNEMSYQELN